MLLPEGGPTAAYLPSGGIDPTGETVFKFKVEAVTPDEIIFIDPLVAIGYPLYVLICVLLSLDVLRQPARTERMMGEMARARARRTMVVLKPPHSPRSEVMTTSRCT